MFGSMTDIQSATAENRRGKNKEERIKKDRKKKNTGRKYKGLSALFHRAAIKIGYSEFRTWFQRKVKTLYAKAEKKTQNAKPLQTHKI